MMMRKTPLPRCVPAGVPFIAPFIAPLALGLMALLLPGGVGAQVHRCTGANGVVEYRSLPCEGPTSMHRLLDLPAQQPQRPAPPPSANAADVQRQATEAQVARVREAAARLGQPQQSPVPGLQAPTSTLAPTPTPAPALAQAPAQPQAPADTGGVHGMHRPGFGPAMRPVELPLLASLGAQPPADVAAGSEVLVVTGYETSERVPEVVVDRPGQQVVLVLSTYEKVLWKVSATPGTRIQAILVASLHKPVSAVSGPPGTRLWEANLSYTAQAATPEVFATWDALVRSRFGAAQLHALRSGYRLPGVQRYERPDPAGARVVPTPPPPEAPSVDIRFELPTLDQRLPVAWTNAGPMAPGDAARVYFTENMLAQTPDGTLFGVMGDSVLRASGGSRTPLAPLPPSFPSVNRPTDLAYDPVGGILVLTTLGGEGFLYRYDVRAERWLDYRSVSGIDITALAHDPVTRGYAAWTTSGELLVISAQGDLTSRHRLEKPMGIPTEKLGRPLLVPRGNGIALLQVQGGTVQAIWTFNTTTRAVQLTWRAPAPEGRPTFKPVAQSR